MHVNRIAFCGRSASGLRIGKLFFSPTMFFEVDDPDDSKIFEIWSRRPKRNKKERKTYTKRFKGENFIHGVPIHCPCERCKIFAERANRARNICVTRAHLLLPRRQREGSIHPAPYSGIENPRRRKVREEIERSPFFWKRSCERVSLKSQDLSRRFWDSGGESRKEREFHLRRRSSLIRTT